VPRALHGCVHGPGAPRRHGAHHICGERRPGELGRYRRAACPPVDRCIYRAQASRPLLAVWVWPGLSRWAHTTMRHSLEQLCRDPHPRRRSPSPATWRITSPPRHPSARGPTRQQAETDHATPPAPRPSPSSPPSLSSAPDLVYVRARCAPIPAAFPWRDAVHGDQRYSHPPATGHAHGTPTREAGWPEDKIGVRRARRPAMAPYACYPARRQCICCGGGWWTRATAHACVPSPSRRRLPSSHALEQEELS
jgi:hypothetical protein